MASRSASRTLGLLDIMQNTNLTDESCPQEQQILQVQYMQSTMHWVTWPIHKPNQWSHDDYAV